MRRLFAISMSAALLLAVTPLMAVTMAERFGSGAAFAGLHAGTLGPGVNAGYDFSKDLTLRGLYNHFNLDFDKKRVGKEYEGKMRLRSLGLLLDWHPFWGAFRVSGGGFLNNNTLSASTEGKLLKIGSHEYQNVELDFRMDFERLAPYLGIGWTSGRGRGGLSFTADVGALLRSAPKVSASGRADGCDFSISTGGDVVVCSGDPGVAASDLEEEHEKLRDDLDKLKVYPVISLGVSYRF